MTHLHAPLAQKLAPLLCTVKAAMDAFDRQVASPGPLPAENACGNKRHTGTSRASGATNTVAAMQPKNAPQGLFTAPADLQGFVHAHTVAEVARALDMSRKTAWRLRQGNWPQDTRKVLRAWAAFTGLSAQQSGWFLRRVHAGGVVRHAGRQWAAPALAARTGQTLAAARVSADTLLVQTLHMPAERFTLAATKG